MLSKIFTTSALAVLALSGPALADWSTTVVGQGHTAPGATGQVNCPAGGSPGAIWGTGTYTSDSSICGAAQHYGWIPPGGGGTVSYQTVPGLSTYNASTQHGISSNSYAQWGLSFHITAYVPAPPTPPGGGGAPTYQQIGWGDNPDGLGHGAQEGQVYYYSCPANYGAPGTIWGSDPYTSDSPVCAAAQHRGLITSGGGNVTVAIGGWHQSYSPSTNYGITSSQYGEWPRSYSFR